MNYLGRNLCDNASSWVDSNFVLLASFWLQSELYRSDEIRNTLDSCEVFFELRNKLSKELFFALLALLSSRSKY